MVRVYSYKDAFYLFELVEVGTKLLLTGALGCSKIVFAVCWIKMWVEGLGFIG